MDKLMYLRTKVLALAWTLGLVSALIIGSTSCSDDEVDCAAQPALCRPDASTTADSSGQKAADLGASADGATSPEDAAARDAGMADGPVADGGTTEGDAAQGDAGSYEPEKVSIGTVHDWIEDGVDMTLIDVRPASSYDAGHLPGAINLAYNNGDLEAALDTIPRNKPVVVYCQSGVTSAKAAKKLTENGFRPVYDMWQAFPSWKNAGYDVETE